MNATANTTGPVFEIGDIVRKGNGKKEWEVYAVTDMSTVFSHVEPGTIWCYSVRTPGASGNGSYISAAKLTLIRR